MRIVNILAHSQHYSYASTTGGGRTLQPGESTGRLPFERLLLPQLWKDVKSNKIVIRLDEEDNRFMLMLTEEADKPIKVAELPKPTPPPKPVAKKSDKPKKQPARVVDALKVMYPEAKGKPGQPSLDDLRRENAKQGIMPVPVTGKSNQGEISTFMKDRV